MKKAMMTIDDLKAARKTFLENYLKYHNEYDELYKICKDNASQTLYSSLGKRPVQFDIADILGSRSFKYTVLSEEKDGSSKNRSEHYYNVNGKLIMSCDIENKRRAFTDIIVRDGENICVLSFDKNGFLQKVQITEYKDKKPILYSRCQYSSYYGFTMDHSEFTYDDRDKLSVVYTANNRTVTDETDKEMFMYDHYIKKCMEDDSLLTMPVSIYTVECIYNNDSLARVRSYGKNVSQGYISDETVTDIKDSLSVIFKKIISDLVSFADV
ncbi:MAG: hypothetical protein ACI4J0_08360 [Huintestinicola sp.]|uniref:hypothetical protein n=1 Tax=Huintestinicola sp. TaxID=2981661 RepID=UPI003F0DF6FF